MKKLVQVIRPEWVFLNIAATNQKQVLSLLANELIQQQVVKPSFLDAILNREKVYPTGLKTQGGGVAIPHADPSHVILEAVTIGVLEQAVTFQMMEKPDQSLKVDIIFMLAIKDPNRQIDLLQELVSIFQDPRCLHELREAKSADQVLRILKQVKH